METKVRGSEDLSSDPSLAQQWPNWTACGHFSVSPASPPGIGVPRSLSAYSSGLDSAHETMTFGKQSRGEAILFQRQLQTEPGWEVCRCLQASACSHLLTAPGCQQGLPGGSTQLPGELWEAIHFGAFRLTFSKDFRTFTHSSTLPAAALGSTSLN